MAKMRQYPGLPVRQFRPVQPHAEPAIDILRDQAKIYGVSETPHPHPAAQRLLAELHAT